METEVKEITINGVSYIPKSSVKEIPEVSKEWFIVRTYSAGVFFTNIKSRNGMEAVITNARRLWCWYGAASLSQLAMEGVKNPKDCKFSVPVTETILTQVIEIIPCSESAIKSINGVPLWQNK